MPSGVVRTGLCRALPVSGSRGVRPEGPRSISLALASALIHVLALSTEDTAWVLVPEVRRDTGCDFLGVAGGEIGGDTA
ncbi:MAG: hypothetical protein ACRENX_07075 [Candidatus Dormibacteria bacterium]